MNDIQFTKNGLMKKFAKLLHFVLDFYHKKTKQKNQKLFVNLTKTVKQGYKIVFARHY